MSCGIVARSWLLIFTIFFLFVFAQENISYENKKFVFIFLLTKRCDRIFCSLMIQRVQILLLSNVNRNTWTAATISRSRDETRQEQERTIFIVFQENLINMQLMASPILQLVRLLTVAATKRINIRNRYSFISFSFIRTLEENATRFVLINLDLMPLKCVRLNLCLCL